MTKRLLIGLILAVFFVNCTTPSSLEKGFEHFITTEGDKLMDGDVEYRFMSFNIPNLHMVEDQMTFDEIQPWRLPNSYELHDALASIQQMGGQVIRTYVITVIRPDDLPGTPKHVLGPGVFNESAFLALDTMMAVAAEHDIRVIIPFVDNWPWMGGRAEYAGFRGMDKDDFWSDSLLIADFKQTIYYLINRVNTVTGIPYREDKALLAWETGNELYSTPEWVAEIAEYIKELDPNHLVVDGFHSNILRESSLTDSNIDFVTTHHYEKDPRLMVRHIRENQARSSGIKPYFVGEFGFISTAGLAAAMDAIIETGTSGGLSWSLRFHSRDGGFYWHSEHLGLGLYKAFHWPGFESGSAYDETAVLQLMREKAFEIRGMNQPDLEVPAVPVLLPIKLPIAINWLGSTGASGYDLQRAPEKSGPWEFIARNLSDANEAYRSLFNDGATTKGHDYYYRVRANNSAGSSVWSPASNRVAGVGAFIVDPMERTANIFSSGGNLEFTRSESRKAKEDLYRLAGEANAYIQYFLPEGIYNFQIDCFFPNEVLAPSLELSLDGESFSNTDVLIENFFQEAKAYGYWKPVRYSTRDLDSEAKYLRIKWNTDMQIAHTIIGS